ncbi:MAG TPA: M17 family peptidase N-terminal domain-containing protein [Gemmataceae bacterium]|nr:M17 family peptidase N-terminal domain-containing protein [Gemmataceae bacterium]
MKVAYRISCVVIVGAASLIAPLRTDAQEVKEKAFDAPNKVKIKVRMEGPYTADVPLQIVCYFKYTPEGAKRMSGAPVELDNKLGGVIASLRERGEFTGDRLEMLCITPPKNAIKAKALLLIGLGSEDELSLKILEGVGRAGLREAAMRGVKRVAFAPLIRDQGNTKLSASDVEIAVVRGMLLAYDTEKRLQKEGLAKPFTLDEWNVEAGPQYFDETVTAADKAIQQATTALKDRSAEPYIRSK